MRKQVVNLKNALEEEKTGSFIQKFFIMKCSPVKSPRKKRAHAKIMDTYLLFSVDTNLTTNQMKNMVLFFLMPLKAKE